MLVLAPASGDVNPCDGDTARGQVVILTRPQPEIRTSILPVGKADIPQDDRSRTPPATVAYGGYRLSPIAILRSVGLGWLEIIVFQDQVASALIEVLHLYLYLEALQFR
jgi:hypothetical protein